MRNRLVDELEEYVGYVPEAEEEKPVPGLEMPEYEYNTYEVLVKEITEYTVRVNAKSMDDALSFIAEMKEDVVRDHKAEKYSLISMKSPYAYEEDGSCEWAEYDYRVQYEEDEE